MNRRLFMWLCVTGLCAARPVFANADSDDAPTSTAVLTQRAYEAAKARYQTNNNDDAIARQFTTACFDWADNTSQESVRAIVAREGTDACRRWLQRSPNQAAAHYYLGMNLGQLARTKSLGALPMVREMEKEWLTTASLDPHFDYAGADRNLGLLYRDTPGFPLSIGNRGKAEQHIERAVELAPEYPENHLNRIETHLKRKPAAVADEYQKLRAILPAARKQFSGPEWQGSWGDWDARIKKLQVKLPEGK